MARILVVLALLGVCCATPVPSNTLPKIILGTYTTMPEKEQNFAEFAKVLRMPEGVSFSKRNSMSFRQEGDTYYHRMWFYPTRHFIDLPFKLGETQTTVINGKNVEYVYTTDEGVDADHPVLRAKFRETDGDVKFTVEATFSNCGYNATYTRDNVVAKRSYRRTLPWYVLGAYELDQTQDYQKSLDLFNTLFPLPKGVTWTKDVKLMIGSHNGKFYDKLIPSPTFYHKIPFKLNEKTTYKHGNETVEYKYWVGYSSPNKTVLNAKFKTESRGVITFNCTYTHDGVTSVVKSDKGEVTTHYKRVLPWSFDGTYELVPEKTQNWDKFTQDDYKIPVATKQVLYRKGDQYVVKHHTQDNKDIKWTFKLNTPTETTVDGKTIKYNVTYGGLGDDFVVFVRKEMVGTDKQYMMEKIYKQDGVYVTFRRGFIEATMFYRRVIPKMIFGTFESTEVTEDFKAFTNAIGKPDMAKKSTIELSKTGDNKFTKKATTEGSPAHEITFSLGEPQEITFDGKTFNSTYYYFELEKTPVLRGHYNQTNGPVHFDSAVLFYPKGFNVTYTYADHKLATRTYNRVGAEVPYETTTD